MKTGIMSIVSGLSFWATVSMAAAGGWTSSGGELIKDAGNPWFLENTKTVSYCLALDEQNFGQSKEQISARVKNVIAFWKRQFTDYNFYNFGDFQTQFKIATQNFVEVSCEQKPDIRFQFGVINQEQREFFGNPAKIIGAAVRTEYDVRNLKGKGFIYFSPERGPLKPDLPTARTKLWSTSGGVLLTLALIHEMGHVFGLPHVDNIFLMHASTLNDLSLYSVQGDDNRALEFEQLFLQTTKLFKIEGMDHFGNTFVHCSPSSSSGSSLTPQMEHFFFGLPLKEGSCSRFKMKDNMLQLYWGEERDRETQLIGEVEIEHNYAVHSYKETDNAIFVLLPEGQQVYPNALVEKYGSRLNVGSFEIKRTFKGVYRSVDGAIQRKVYFDLDRFGLNRIGGIYNNDLILNIYSGY